MRLRRYTCQGYFYHVSFAGIYVVWHVMSSIRGCNDRVRIRHVGPILVNVFETLPYYMFLYIWACGSNYCVWKSFHEVGKEWLLISVNFMTR